MSCKQEAECCITQAKIILSSAGSFDVVEPLYRLRKNDVVHVLCDPTTLTETDGTAIYQASKIYPILDADTGSFMRAFKFEVGEVRAHYGRESETTENNMSTPDLKRKAEDNQLFSSPAWASQTRRLKIQTTIDARMVGVQPQKTNA